MDVQRNDIANHDNYDNEDDGDNQNGGGSDGNAEGQKEEDYDSQDYENEQELVLEAELYAQQEREAAQALQQLPMQDSEEYYQGSQAQQGTKRRGSSNAANEAIALSNVNSKKGTLNPYQLRNLELLEKIREKKQRAQEDLERARRKKEKKSRKLRQQVLGEAAKVREGKGSPTAPTTVASQRSGVSAQSQQQGAADEQTKLRNKLRKKRLNDLLEAYERGRIDKALLSEDEQRIIEEYEQKKEEEKMQRAKLGSYFKNRYASFLGSLKEMQDKKRLEEEEKKKRQSDLLEKARKNLNLEKVQSNLLAPTKAQKLREEITLPLIRQKRFNRSASDDTMVAEQQQPEDIGKARDAQRRLLEKQQEYINKLKEKKVNEIQQKEEEARRKEELKRKMQEFVTVHIKNEIEKGNWIVEDVRRGAGGGGAALATNHLQQQNNHHQGKKTVENRQQRTLQENDSQVLKALDLEVKMQVKKKSVRATQQQGEQERGEGQYDDEQGSGSDELESPSRKGAQQKEKKKLRSYPFISDLAQWLKKQRLPEDTKIFIVTGGYPDVKRALRNRGWLENPDPYSPCFNLKYSLQSKELGDFTALKDFQIVNHFEKNTVLTTKIGVCKNMRNLIWFNNVDIDTFYPRCYDLNDPEDIENFTENFKTTKAEAVLKTYIRLWRSKDPLAESMRDKAKIALNICERLTRDLDELVNDKSTGNFRLVSDKDWEVLAEDELNSDSLAVKKHQSWLEKLEKKYGANAQGKKKKKKRKKADLTQKADQEDEDEDEDEDDEDDNEDEGDAEKGQQQQSEDKAKESAQSELAQRKKQKRKMDDFTKKVSDVLKRLKEKFPQSCINGEGNFWIVKPAGLSRGRGIQCFNSLIEIIDHIKSKEMQWIIQKYIENPLIIHKRKFDIRAWILVTSYNPLTVWLYNELYIRLAAIDYTAEAKQLSDRFTHLTNNVVSSKCTNSVVVGEGNMLSQEQFADYLSDLEGEDIFYARIEPAIKEAVVNTLQCAQDQIENRPNTHEMFGYDFMIDDQYNVWFIEINSSPSMDYSTPITTRLVKQGLDDLIKVVVDYNMAKKGKKKIDTGGWKRIYKGSKVDDKPTNMGLNLCLEGTALKKGSKKPNLAKVNNVQLNVQQK